MSAEIGFFGVVQRVMYYFVLCAKIVYSVPGGPDTIQISDAQPPPTQEKHPLLLRAAPKSTILSLLFDSQTDINFLTPVITCHQYFISDNELFLEAMERLSGGGAEGACRVLFIWSNNAPEDFQALKNRSCVEKLFGAVRVAKEGGFFWKEMVRRIDSFEKEFAEKEKKGGGEEGFEMNKLEFYKVGDPKKVKKGGQVIFQLKSIETIAAHFFSWCYELQSQISVAEVATNPLSARQNQSGANLAGAIGLLNDVTGWVSLMVLSQPVAEERGKMICYFITLMEECVKQKNYFLGLGVCFGLREGSVERLKDSWLLVPPDRLSAFETVKELFASTKNFASLRNVLVMDPSPACMYLGVALRDLIYLHDSSPSFVGENQTMVNVLKCKQIFLIVRRWHIRPTEVAHSYNTNKNIALYLSAIYGTARVIPKEYLQAVSLYLEPKKKDEAVTPPLLDPAQDAKIQLLIPHYSSSSYVVCSDNKEKSDSKSKKKKK